jgi:hypothetical protein
MRYLGSAYTECPKTLRAARELGLGGWPFFVAGIGGALGDVHPDTVAAAVGFIAPEAVRDAWLTARQAAPPAEIARQNLAQCCRWGMEKLDGFAGVERLADLAERASSAADETGMPLLAAWRAMTRPLLTAADIAWSAGARTALNMNLLRHHRASTHLVAVRATGLTPVEAILACEDGDAGAAAFGWQRPYPPSGPLIRKRAWAEALTDRIAGQAFLGLSITERQEFVYLADAARDFTREPAIERPHLAPQQRREAKAANAKEPKASRIGSAVRVDP